MNDYQFKLVKLQGEFVWHDHKDTDEVFLVVHGEMQIGFRDRDVTVRAGEMFVVPRGVEHITRAANECHALIVEPRGVVTTGDAGGSLTAGNDVWPRRSGQDAGLVLYVDRTGSSLGSSGNRVGKLRG